MRHIKMDLNIKKQQNQKRKTQTERETKNHLVPLSDGKTQPQKNVGNGLWEAMSMNRSIPKRSWKRERASDAMEMGKVRRQGRGDKTTNPKSLTFLGSIQQQQQQGGSCRFVIINRYA